MNAVVELDLRRDLPLVREQFDDVLAAQRVGRCDYTAPCVVGAMVPRTLRRGLEWAETDAAGGDTAIGVLIAEGFVTVPPRQKRAFVALQDAFDSGDEKRFLETLQRIERRYLASAIETRSDETEGLSPKGESAVPKGDAQ